MPININGRIIYGPRSSNPSSTNEGDQYYHTGDDKVKFYTGSEWRDVNYAELGTISNPAGSAADLHSAGKDSGNYYVSIHGTTLQMFYDHTNKFSTGTHGWLRYDNTFVGSNSGVLGATIFNSGSSCTTQWVDQSSGKFSTGNSTSNTGASHMGRMTLNLPDMQFAQIAALNMTQSGSQTPDDNTNWINHHSSQIDDYMYKTSGFMSNPAGYVWGIWDGNTNGTYSAQTNSSGSIILPKEGGETGSSNGTRSYDSSDFPHVSFNNERSNPKLAVWAGDSGSEIITWNTYTLWVH